MSEGGWSQASRTAVFVVVFLIIGVIAVSLLVELLIR